MAESTLSMNYTKLVQIIGRYLGYGSDSSKWNGGMLEVIHDVLDSGIRQFYNPPPIQGQMTGHNWSFLQPIASLDVESGIGDYTLPDNFGGLMSRFSYGPGDGYLRLSTVSEFDMRQLRQASKMSGRPNTAAVTPVIAAGQPTRWEARFWPEPDSDYTLYYRYQVILEAVRTANSYPLGGAPHAETIKQSCLAIAEQHKNEERGVQYQLFIENLVRSVAFDQTNSTPDYLGYNGNEREGTPAPLRRNTRVFYNETQILGGN